MKRQHELAVDPFCVRAICVRERDDEIVRCLDRPLLRSSVEIVPLLLMLRVGVVVVEIAVLMLRPFV